MLRIVLYLVEGVRRSVDAGRDDITPKMHRSTPYQGAHFIISSNKAGTKPKKQNHCLETKQILPSSQTNHGPVPVPILPEGGRRGGPAPVAPQVRHGRVGPGPVRWVSSAAHVQGEKFVALCFCNFHFEAKTGAIIEQ